MSHVTLLGQKLMAELIRWASSEFLVQIYWHVSQIGIFRPWWLKVKEHPDCGLFVFCFTKYFLGIFILMV